MLEGPEALEKPGRKANGIHQEKGKTAGPPGGQKQNLFWLHPAG
jgi:hypothetical protein